MAFIGADYGMTQQWVKGSGGQIQSKWKSAAKEPSPLLKEDDQVDINGQPSADEIDNQKLQEAMMKLQAMQAGKLNKFTLTEKDLKKIAEEEFTLQRPITEEEAKKIEASADSSKEKVVKEKDGTIYAESPAHIETDSLKGLMGKEMMTDDMTGALKQAGYSDWQIEAIENRALKYDPRKAMGLKTLKYNFTDMSKDGLLVKAPQLGITAAQVALMIITGSLCPPLLPALGLGAIGLVANLILKDANKRVQQNAQAKALAEAAGIEPQYAKHIVDMQAKQQDQLKQLNKFTTKAMKNDDMNEWVTNTLKEAENEPAINSLEAGKNVKENWKQWLARNIMGLYQPESAQARAIFLEMLLRGVIVGDKQVMEFLETQPEKRQEAVKAQAEDLKQKLIADHKAAQEAAAKQATEPLNEVQQMAFLSSFTETLIGDPKMKEFCKNVAFKDQPDAFDTLCSDRNDDQSRQLKTQMALAALTKGLLEQNPDAVAFTQGLAKRFPPNALGFLDSIVTATAANMQAPQAVEETAQTEVVQNGLSQQEKLQTLRDFSTDFLNDKTMEDFTRNVAYKHAPQIANDLYNTQIPVDPKIDYIMAAFTTGLLDENPDVAAFNDKVTPKYTGAKEEFLSEIITQQSEAINKQREAAQAQ